METCEQQEKVASRAKVLLGIALQIQNWFWRYAKWNRLWVGWTEIPILWAGQKERSQGCIGKLLCLGPKKTRNLLGQKTCSLSSPKKNHSTSWAKKIMQPLGPKKSCIPTSWDKKNTQPLRQTKTLQTLRPKQNLKTSCAQNKSRNLSGPK